MDNPKWPEIETDWEPSEEDLQWCRNVGACLTEGGIWTIPASTHTYQLWPAKKQIKLLHGDPFHPNSQRTSKAFKTLGWTVILRVQNQEVH